ncbi:membrane protein [Kordiimonas sediminis]|uniref:Membrane protein n=1 Tax=Kordiimonas sediminis TaxID=1735581 RepID=A0A919AL60_9PROT|nr:heparan-alpha-glucosaminide N-acetyltransferase domain-containing protein [Kordiimonas sediminis]GHF13824.1 membrane protein [Kordiimonas sediminis]
MWRRVQDHLSGIMAQCNPDRSLAIDVFRGITITGMILVNNPGSWDHVYAPLLHAKWHGWTPTDLIFPFFIFIVGLSAAFAAASQNKIQGTTAPNRTAQLKTAAIRSAKLFGLGLFLAIFYYDFQASNYSWFTERIENIRILGVLQRIALVFFCMTLLRLYASRTVEYAACVFLLALYTFCMAFTPYPLPTGGTGVGGWAFGENFTAYIDALILGSAHSYYANATPFPFDPEGIFSTLPAIVTGMLGLFTGRFLLAEKNAIARLKRLIPAGILLTLLGLVLDPVIPINKALWTPSYVLLTAGLAVLSLAFCIYLLDIRKTQRWSAPFIVFGANAIAFYMFSAVAARILTMIPVGETSLHALLYSKVFMPLFGPLNGSLAFALAFLALSYGAMYAMYKRKIFWKV